MLAKLYFPLISALSGRHPPAELLVKLLEGDLSAALAQAERRLEQDCKGEDEADLLQLMADLQLTTDIYDEAEESYRRSQKLRRGPKHLIRAASCRNTGWQALFRYRMVTSLSCFARLVDESSTSPEQKMEARLGIVCALHELGRIRECTVELNRLLEIAQNVDGLHAPHWRDVLLVMRYDLAVQRELRCAAPHSDHVYWQSGLHSGCVAAQADEAAKAVDQLEREVSSVGTPLLRARIDYLRCLRGIAYGRREAIEGLHDHLAWGRRRGMADYVMTSRIEVIFAALCCDALQLSESMLESLNRVDFAGVTGHRQLEYLYCLSKVRQAQGRGREAMQTYSRYAMIAAQCLRGDTQVNLTYLNQAPRHTPQLDDISARLPAKYRRAYRYLQENLDRHDLSVRELAAEIGVTERALQGAFKNALGLSPSELIRSLRMERIRAELLTNEVASEHGVLQIAAKWGIQSRSTLVSGYKKQFHEAPSETLDR
jgi:AraC-like DNA-binding protein